MTNAERENPESAGTLPGSKGTNHRGDSRTDNYTPKTPEGQEKITDFDRMAAADDVMDAETSRAIECASAWENPRALPDNMPSVPAFDEALLPDSLRPWVTDASERMQTPPDFIAAPVLVAAGVAIGRQIRIKPMKSDPWTVTANLWGASIGTSGKMKSPSQAEAFKPLQRLEQAAREQHEAELIEYKAAEVVAKQSEKEAEKAIGKAIRDGNRDKADRLARELTADKPEPPRRKRFISQDSTVEKLGELLAANPNGVAVLRDELTGFLKALDREGQECARAFYLEAWNGDEGFTFDRIGRGTIDIEAACVSVFGGIQPGPLSAYVSQAVNNGAGADGLLQRFQVMTWPDVSPTWKPVDRPANEAARQQAFDVFDRLANLPEIEGAFVRFDNAAQVAFNEWRANLEQRLRSGKESEAFEAVLSKQRSLVPSIALICHLCDSERVEAVSEAATLRAIAWAEYLEAHARRIYAPALDRQAEAAKALGRKIEAGEIRGPFVARDVYRKGWAGLASRDAVEAALDALELRGWVRRIEVQTDGRPRSDWHINPKVSS